jgi:protein-tyrosine phosphatase
MESFDELISAILASMKRYKPVCVHCFAGIGRTGLVLCCAVGRYLRLPAQAAITEVRKIRPALETAEQERWVHRYLKQ